MPAVDDLRDLEIYGQAAQQIRVLAAEGVRLGEVVDLARERERLGKEIGKLDVDANEEVPQKYKVMNLPTMLFFKAGRETGKIVGAVGRAKIEAELQQQLA